MDRRDPLNRWPAPSALDMVLARVVLVADAVTALLGMVALGLYLAGGVTAGWYVIPLLLSVGIGQFLAIKVTGSRVRADGSRRVRNEHMLGSGPVATAVQWLFIGCWLVGVLTLIRGGGQPTGGSRGVVFPSAIVAGFLLLHAGVAWSVLVQAKRAQPV